MLLERSNVVTNVEVLAVLLIRAANDGAGRVGQERVHSCLRDDTSTMGLLLTDFLQLFNESIGDCHSREALLQSMRLMGEEVRRPCRDECVAESDRQGARPVKGRGQKNLATSVLTRTISIKSRRFKENIPAEADSPVSTRARS